MSPSDRAKSAQPVGGCRACHPNLRVGEPGLSSPPHVLSPLNPHSVYAIVSRKDSRHPERGGWTWVRVPRSGPISKQRWAWSRASSAKCQARCFQKRAHMKLGLHLRPPCRRAGRRWSNGSGPCRSGEGDLPTARLTDELRRRVSRGSDGQRRYRTLDHHSPHESSSALRARPETTELPNDSVGLPASPIAS
jgi:hypothetical protein